MFSIYFFLFYFIYFKLSIHEANGIQFKMNSRLVKIIDDNNDSKLDAILCETIEESDRNILPTYKSEKSRKPVPESKEIKADMVLLAIGVNPNTEILQSTVTLEKELATCDSYLSTSDPDIWAAGDILTYPSVLTGERIYSPHWVNAQQQGSIAALNMLGKNIAYDYIPYFWTRFFEKTLQYVGVTDKFDEVIIEGNFEVNKTDSPSFKAFYIKNKKVCGFACMNSPNSANIMYEILKNNYIITAGAIKKHDITVEKLGTLLKKMNSQCSKVNCLCAKREESKITSDLGSKNTNLI
jgi:NADPH-dependent 2,4-dienoyl-CoA reductase/sulfur reductase-like enzyme